MQLTPDQRYSGYIERVYDAVIRSRPRVFLPAACGSGTRGGKAAHATELIAKAVIAHESLPVFLTCMRASASWREKPGTSGIDSILSTSTKRKEALHV